jgi:DNA recombination protein RmuC
MDDAKKEYGNAMNKLVEGKGNLINRVENLKQLGIKSQKNLPENVLKRAIDED